MAHLKTDLFRHINAVLTPADELPARYGQVGHNASICGLHKALLLLGSSLTYADLRCLSHLLSGTLAVPRLKLAVGSVCSQLQDAACIIAIPNGDFEGLFYGRGLLKVLQMQLLSESGLVHMAGSVEAGLGEQHAIPAASQRRRSAGAPGGAPGQAARPACIDPGQHL